MVETFDGPKMPSSKLLEISEGYKWALEEGKDCAHEFRELYEMHGDPMNVAEVRGILGV